MVLESGTKLGQCEVYRAKDPNLRLRTHNFIFYDDVALEADRFFVVQGVERGRSDVVLVRYWAQELGQP